MPPFLNNVILIGISNILNKISIPILSIILSINFSPNKYGAWSMIITAIPLLVYILDFGLTKSFLRFFYENISKEKKNLFFINYLYLRVLSYIVLLLIIFCILFIFWDVSSLNYFSKYPFLFIILLVSLAESHTSLIVSFLRVKRYSKLLLLIRFLQFFCTISFSLFLSKYYGVIGAVFGFSLSIILISIIFTFYFIYDYKKKIQGYSSKAKLRNTKPILIYSIPFFINDIAVTIRNVSLPFFLSIFLPLSMVGNFHIATMFASIITLLIVTFDMVLAPYYYEYRNKKKNKQEIDFNIKLVSNLVICLISVCTIVLSIITITLFHFLFSNKDIEIARIIPILLIGFYFQAYYIMWAKPCLFTKNNKFLPMISMVVSIIMFGGIYVFVPKYGIIIPAIFSSVSFIIYSLLILLVSKRYDKTGLEFLIYIPCIIFVITSIFLNLILLEGKIDILPFCILNFILILLTIYSLIFPKFQKSKLFLKNFAINHLT